MIHNHPLQERKLKVPKDHVIIDADLYWEMVKRFGDYFPAEGEEDNDKKRPRTISRMQLKVIKDFQHSMLRYMVKV